MSYRVSQEEVNKQQDEYKKNYPPFEPFKLSDEDLNHIVETFSVLLTTQNGQDTDDYCVDDTNKVDKYLKKSVNNESLLILGTGTGREVLVAKELGYRAAGTTLGSRNVYFGRNYLGLSEDELIECSNESLPFDSRTFDVVAGFQIFEHTLSPLQFLLEQSRVLKDGGKLFLEWPPAKHYHMDDNPHHQVCFTPGQAHALLRKAGFGGIKLFYSNMEEIPEEDYWRGDQSLMLCVEAYKVVSLQPYINYIRK